MIEKLKEKYVFFDVDGILSEYRYKDRLYSVTNWCQEVSENLTFFLFRSKI